MHKFSKVTQDSSYGSGRRYASPGWRMVLTALVLALLLGSPGRISPARAAQDEDETYHYRVDVINPLGHPLCIGQSKEYNVRIMVSGSISTTAAITLGGGTTISAEVADPSIVSLTTARTMWINTPSPSLIRPGIAVLTITGEKQGDTTITFSADVVEFGHTFKAEPFPPVPIKVIHCKYRVFTVSKWLAGMTSTASMDGEMTADETAFIPYFTGTADVNWATSMLCGIKSPIEASTADLTGTINDRGQLDVEITFGPASSSGGGSCGVSVTTSNFATPASLRFTVPASGGVFRQTQVVTAVNGSFPGPATIIVIPLDGAK